MSARAGSDAPSLRPALDADLRFLDGPSTGRVGYYVDASKSGRPLLLVHSLNAAPSAAEMQPLFDHYRRERPVAALDLPGFGVSERGDRAYTPEMLAAAVDAVAQEAFDSPADVIALSLGSEIAARAILSAPERWRSLCLLSPTGFASRQPPGESITRGMESLFGARLLGEPLFRLLTTEGSIRFFLARNFVGPPAEEMMRYARETALQPGARFAPFRFLSGRLFTRNALEKLYDRLPLPVLVLYDQDPNVSFDRLTDWVAARDGRSARRIRPTRGLPHWEELDPCVEALDQFWKDVEGQPGL